MQFVFKKCFEKSSKFSKKIQNFQNFEFDFHEIFDISWVTILKNFKT